MANYSFLNVRVTFPSLADKDRAALNWLCGGNDMAKAPASSDLPDHEFFTFLVGQQRSAFGTSYGSDLMEETGPTWDDEDDRVAVAKLDGLSLVVNAACKSWVLHAKAASYLISLGAQGFIDQVSEERNGYSGHLIREVHLDTDKRHTVPTSNDLWAY